MLTVRAESIWDIYGCMGYMGIYRISKRRMLVDCHLNPYIKSIGRMLVDCEGAGRQLPICSSSGLNPYGCMGYMGYMGYERGGCLLTVRAPADNYSAPPNIHLPANL